MPSLEAGGGIASGRVGGTDVGSGGVSLEALGVWFCGAAAVDWFEVCSALDVAPAVGPTDPDEVLVPSYNVIEVAAMLCVACRQAQRQL